MTRELGAALCDRLWRVMKTLKSATLDLEKLNVSKDDILVKIESQKTYVIARHQQRLPLAVQQLREVADNIEKSMIERCYELEQVHTRLRGHKTAQAVFNRIRRKRPAIEREIRRYNDMVDALAIAPDYDLLQKEMNGMQETSSLLHNFFMLDNFGTTESGIRCWVKNWDMRRAIQLYLHIQALHQEIKIIRAEVTRAVKWAMENLNASKPLFLEKLWAGVQVVTSFVEKLDSMYNADFSMEEAKTQKQGLQVHISVELIELAYLHLPSAGQDSDGEVVAVGDSGVSSSADDFVDEEEEDPNSTDGIFELDMLSLEDNHVHEEEVDL
ncbi:hypothetical protein V1525DRAFT_428864 [Lipomyces kononenkoae]|uniref:Uncharacterized protein n=1 Tax=Lipomyces kononenkoae TaxID=34357 RepID=A0ACC3SRR9_LIPKO